MESKKNLSQLQVIWLEQSNFLDIITIPIAWRNCKVATVFLGKVYLAITFSQNDFVPLIKAIVQTTAVGANKISFVPHVTSDISTILKRYTKNIYSDNLAKHDLNIFLMEKFFFYSSTVLQIF